MKKTIELCGQTIEYELTRKKVKNINLRIKSDCTVYVSANNYVKVADIENFIKKNEIFIISAIEKFKNRSDSHPESLQYKTGDTIKILGEDKKLIVNHGIKNTAFLSDDNVILVTTDIDNVALKEKIIENLLREISEDVIEKLCRRYYEYFKQFGIDYPVIKYRKMKSMWGNCRSKSGILTFNIYLANKDIKCIEYVVCHEYTHFLQANHSKLFYKELEKIFPEWKYYRKKLNNQIE